MLRGLTRIAARLAALRTSGNVTSVSEPHREESWLQWPEQALQDFRYAFRSFRQSKTFTVVAMLTLALGIGATAAIFSIVNRVLLHPLAYPDADRLVAINSGNRYQVVSFTRFRNIRERVRTLDGTCAYYVRTMTANSQNEPEQVTGIHVSRDLFPLLGVSPAQGRGFLPDEDQPGGANVAVIADEFWRSHFGADPKATGRSISIDGRVTTIVGILPPGFHFPFAAVEPQVWLPRVFELPGETPERIYSGMGYLSLIGRMRADQTVQATRAELASIARQYQTAFPGFPDASFPLEARPLEASLVANARPSLLALLAAVGFLLCIACVNVASLLLARAASREKEIGIRIALGAASGRIARQFAGEGLLLSFLGGLPGVAAAALCLPLLMHSLPVGTIPVADQVRLDRTALAFSVALCCLTGIVFGLFPLLHVRRTDVTGRMRDASRGSTARGGRLRKAMVVSEVAMAVILMTGAGLLARSLLNLMRVSPGFSSRDVMTLYVSLPPAQYPQADRRLAFYRRLLDRVRGLPGVESAAAVSHMPLGNTPRFFFFCPETTVCKGLGKDPISAWRQVSPDYFGAMRTPLLDGRVFDDRDGPDSPPVAIINKTIADRYFSGLNPIGRHIAGSREKIPMEIVGVVADTKVIALSDAPVEEVYLPYTQNTWSSMTLLVRSGPGLPAPVAAIGQVLRQMDPGLPLASVQSLDEVVSGSIAQPALIADLAGAFALSALLLAAVGIYGVLAHLVTERSKEIAIRMAMGAGRGTIFRLMVSHGMRLVGFGLALGLAASPAVARLLSALLAGTGPADFATMAGAAATFAIVGFCACCFPSRRAMRLDALTVLR